jgi:esterase
MAEDLLELAAVENLRDITIIGHSMGGKTAMYFAQENAFLIDRVVVADMGIKQYKPHHEEIFRGLFEVDVENCPGSKRGRGTTGTFCSGSWNKAVFA